MKQITLAAYNAIHRDYRGVWETERTDWADWDQVRDKFMGKRTMSANGGLIIEGLHFEVVG